jgi:N-acetylglucosamine-6-sulfatase
MLADQGGMDIPMNEPRGSSQNLRYRKRDGDLSAGFPDAFVVDKPVNTNSK